MANPSVPSALLSWFKSMYPTLSFEREWLEQCCDYLQTHFDLTHSQLIKKVETQLLLSDLSNSTSSQHAPLPESISSERAIGDLPKEISLPAREILVQVHSITEIGHSALALETAQQKRINDARGRDRVLDLEDEEGLDRDAPVQFPRAMLKLELSDGHRIVQAIEYRKIEGLGLGIIPLGCKLLVKNVKVRRGLLLLTPENTTIKGFQVDEFDARRDQIFQIGLDLRLGRPAVPLDQQPEPEPSNHTDVPVTNPTQARSSMITNTNIASSVNSTATTSQPLNSRPSSTVPSTSTRPTHPETIVLSDSDDDEEEDYDDGFDFEAEQLDHLP